MNSVDFRLSFSKNLQELSDDFVRREWLLTNGLGGYASGTVSGVPTRRYHGLLIAALPTPLGRQMMLNHLGESVVLEDGSTAFISSPLAALEDKESQRFQLTEFRFEMGLPVWRYQLNKFIIERRMFIPHEQNTIYISYELTGEAGELEMHLQPSVYFRPHEDEPVVSNLSGRYSVSQIDNRFEILGKDDQLPALKLYLDAEEKTFTHDSAEAILLYREEKNRGYPSEGSLWTPGYFKTQLRAGKSVTFCASTESWEAFLALAADDARDIEIERRQRLLSMATPNLQDGEMTQIVLAADQFIVTPIGRVEDAARSKAAGEQPRSVIAGYHWFTDWGRDTMISLEGLTLHTGRHHEARWILHTFASHIRRGLIPNLFPEGERDGLYHTADATLWFFHAVDRYLQITGDEHFLELILPKLIDIVDWHCQGTDFGIEMDHEDKLLRQGEIDYQLTWMDAKVGDWVVTPRRGKAVEINALWYNALRLMVGWLHTENNVEKARSLESLANEVYRSFNQRFWNNKTGYLFDVIDGEDGRDDPACRPNQLFAISLPNAVLDKKHWEAVVDAATEKLLTPVGLRSLSRDHPEYKKTYYGDRRARDAAYHQGTVWAWLIGPFIDAWLRVHPNQQAEARKFLSGFSGHLREAGLGTVSEVFDAEPPFTPRGCIAQAWSVAEIIRSWNKTSSSMLG